jgi:predicted metal-dependent hydrolase
MDTGTRVTFYRGLALYNRGKYLECQDPLEEAYRNADEGERPLVRALIALACGMHLHFSRGGGRGVENLFQRSLMEMDDFRPHHLGVDVDDLVQALQAYLDELRDRRKPGAGFFDRWLAPRIRYRAPQ